MKPTILLVDDDGDLLTLTGFFEDRGWTVERATTGRGGLERFEAAAPDLVVLDLELPDVPGLSVLRRLRRANAGAAVVVLTERDDLETVAEATRLGAARCLTKPVALDRLAAVAERVEGRRSVPSTDDDLGPSPLMREIAARIQRIAAADGTVLLQGEAGTGKAWAARRIHDRSDRRGRPFVAVGCGSLGATLLESELFGHEPGTLAAAPTGKEGLLEVADGGSLFLDDIGDLPSELQPRLLEVLEERRHRRAGGTDPRPVDVRLIAATRDDLRERVSDGSFREDLYYRLAAHSLELPPLRARRPEDIAALGERLLSEIRDRDDRGPRRIADEALGLLVRHSWPGNIRELRNLLERVVILAGKDEAVRPEHLPAELRDASTGKWQTGEPLTLEEVERRHIARVLELNAGNRSRSARALGISRAALYDKMDRYHLRAVGR
jgi:DNA-binding NtrC family response regulator